jgi:hypothetical protein
VNLKSLGLIGMALAALTACDQKSNPSNPTPTPDPMTAFTGSWHSTSTGGACSSTQWVVAQTGATTATITYVATCAGLPITGTANATLSGTTLSWSTNGTAANSCAYVINGTATPATIATDLNVTYTGNVCGTAVSGGDTLHR